MAAGLNGRPGGHGEFPPFLLAGQASAMRGWASRNASFSFSCVDKVVLPLQRIFA